VEALIRTLAHDAAPAAAAAACFRNDRRPFEDFIRHPPRYRWKATPSPCQSRLHHGACVTDVERVGSISSTSGILRAEIWPVTVVIERAGVLRVDQPGVLMLHQLLHHREHVVLAFIDEHFGVALVRLLDVDVSKMHVVDAISRCEPAAYLDGVAA